MPRPTMNAEPMSLRSLRVDDELWAAAQQIAAERGETLSDVLRTALSRYVKRHS